jgi:hypothetical protein
MIIELSNEAIQRGQEITRRIRHQAMEAEGWSEPEAAVHMISPSHEAAFLGMYEHAEDGWMIAERLRTAMDWHDLDDLTSLLYGLCRDELVERDDDLGWRLTALGCKAAPLVDS